jgi:hypothetical protein
VAELEAYRLSDRSTRLRLLPNFLTAFFTGDFERPVFRGLVARVLTVPARDTRPILLASSAALLVCLCHPALLLEGIRRLNAASSATFRPPDGPPVGRETIFDAHAALKT